MKNRVRYFMRKVNTELVFYFFALTQPFAFLRGNKKSQSRLRREKKMTKNYFVNLNPANSPPGLL